jgi:hypothetical protein
MGTCTRMQRVLPPGEIVASDHKEYALNEHCWMRALERIGNDNKMPAIAV